MSRRKDRERALEGKVVRNKLEEPKHKIDVRKEIVGKCFLCGSEISQLEASSLERYAYGKPKQILNTELGRIKSLGGGPKDRICKKCYKEKVEHGS